MVQEMTSDMFAPCNAKPVCQHWVDWLEVMLYLYSAFWCKDGSQVIVATLVGRAAQWRNTSL